MSRFSSKKEYHMQSDLPSTEDNHFVEQFFQPLINDGMQKYVSNVQTELRLLFIDRLALPITINQEEYDNSFVCSPFGYYVSYAMLYLDLVKNPIGRKLCEWVMKSFYKLLPLAKINKCVCVNNWPFATVLWPKMTDEQVRQIRDRLIADYPDHAIVFRSFNEDINHDLLQSLKKNGFHTIASRQIFYTNGGDPEVFKTRIFKSDLKLMRECNYEIWDNSKLKEKDLPRLVELYRMVYLEKYSDLNPQHTTDLLQLGLRTNTIHLRAIVKEGEIDGIVGFYIRNGIMTCPFFGYDTKKPLGDKLYRIMCTVLMLEARDRQILFHQSSGAAFYKTIRRARNCIDYTAVYTKHLPFYRKLPWFCIQGIMNGIGVRFMKDA